MKYEIELHGRTYEIQVELAQPMLMEEFRAYAPAPAAPAVPVEAPVMNAVSNAPVVTGKGELVNSPMPGTILKVNVAQGQIVKEGTVLVILEAMKMENEIMAPKDGTITQVLVEKGASVDTGAPLVVIS